ncbi:MAG: beta-galactosidase [Bacteroidales bacterium]|jgi:hypothetical protein|nr:beta-galactosidase [Bacteroidales bacterium]
MNKKVFCIIAATAIATLPANSAEKNEILPVIINLSGEWTVALDPEDKGINEQWFKIPLAANAPQKGKIKLPGSLQEHGYGNKVAVNTQWTGTINDRAYFNSPSYEQYRQPENIKIPFWLQPDRHYIGVAWYEREIEIPKIWKNRYIELELERTHWETTVYINGTEAGKSDALLTPARFPVDATGTARITIRIDNRLHIPVGINAHSVSDHTQTNWNGIIGQMKLAARPLFRIEAIRVFPDLNAKKARIEVDFAGDVRQSPKTAHNRLSLTIIPKPAPTRTAPRDAAHNRPIPPPQAMTCSLQIPADGSTLTTEIDMTALMTQGTRQLTWSEFDPNLFELHVSCTDRHNAVERKSTVFGMREFKAAGTQFAVNGVPVFLRGTLECCIFPLTGYPAMNEAGWEKIFRRCKEFGLNHLRFHSWCPPEAAFAVADREGIYLQIECGSWANSGSPLGDSSPLDTWLYDESARIMREYGNHPSFCMFTYGNEPSGKNMNDYLRRFVEHWKSHDPRHLYTAGAGWPYLPEADYFNSPASRIYAGGGVMNCILNAQPPSTDYDWRNIIKKNPMPTVSHEIGQWCVYPNFKEIAKYSGVLKAKNFEIFKESLEQNHLGNMADRFLYASGRLQTLCYKADIEAALRTPALAGFQLLDLHDFPGQGTALVGVLDPFWDPKGYVDSKEYHQFCGPTVPLARMKKLVWTTNETFSADIEVANFSGKSLNNIKIEWQLTDSEQNKQGYTLLKADKLPVGNCPITTIEQPLSTLSAPVQLTLSVRITAADEKRSNAQPIAENSWHIWVYPQADNTEQHPSENAPLFTTNLKEAIATAQAGGTVLCCIPKDSLKGDQGGSITTGFSSIFWNTAWTRQAPHTLGICCNPEEPALADFPNDGYSDFQWWDVIHNSATLLLDGFPETLTPTVYFIDDWFTNRRLALLLEARLGNGKIMLCGANLSSNLNTRHAARQFRHSLEKYMASEKFAPQTEINAEKLAEWVK